MARNWWAVVLRGVFAILFALLAWTWPGLTMGALVILFGTYAFADGVLAIIAAISGSHGRSWRTLALEGVLGLGAAAIAFFNPALTAMAFLYVLAAWAIATGLLEIVAAIRLRREIRGEFWLGLAGVASIAFGLVLIARPGAGALAVVWLIAGYAFVFGVLLVALGFRLRKLHASAEDLAHGTYATGHR